MPAMLSKITARQNDHPAAVVGPSDFSLGPGTEVDPELVLSSPDWSLYTIDLAAGKAIFVELPPATDLAAAPFVYMWQFERARRAVTMPLELLEPLSRRVELPPNFGILFSTGRCGSTLASRILSRIPEVWSLSEPDALTNLAFARFDVPGDRMVPLMRAAVRLLFRPPTGRTVGTFVIKPRSEAIVQAPDYAQALPASRNIFMYRDAVGFTDSLFRFAQKLLGPDRITDPESMRRVRRYCTINAPDDVFAALMPPDRPAPDIVEIMALGWVIRMRAYLAARDGGLRMQPLHYHDLNSRRRDETARLLAAFGIPPDHLEMAMGAFASDSQKGTGGDRDLPATPITETQGRLIRKLLADLGMAAYRDERLPAGR